MHYNEQEFQATVLEYVFMSIIPQWQEAFSFLAACFALYFLNKQEAYGKTVERHSMY